jgi:hypothetical protein
MPAPPTTCNAPVTVEVALVAFVIVKILLKGFAIAPVAPIGPVAPVAPLNPVIPPYPRSPVRDKIQLL